MDNLIVVKAIFLASLVLGLIKFGSLDSRGWKWQQKFAEAWNDFVNFTIAGFVGYYFILVRWPILQEGRSLNTSDFFLLAIFAMGLFGHLCVLSKNITDGIEAILKRVLERK